MGGGGVRRGSVGVGGGGTWFDTDGTSFLAGAS